MRTVTIFPFFLVLLGVQFAACAGWVTSAYGGQDVLKTRQEAVALARTGDYPAAVRLLEQLHAEHPDDRGAANDFIVISAWNQEPEKACRLFEQQKPDTYPLYVLEAAMGSYRAIRRPERAFDLLQRIKKMDPKAKGLLLQEGLLYVDQRSFDRAGTILQAIQAANGKGQDYYILSGYIHSAEEDWMAALNDFQKLSEFFPDTLSYQKDQFVALQHLRASHATLNHPILQKNYTPQEWADLKMNLAAQRLRWSTDATLEYEETKLMAMQALGLQIEALELLSAGSDKSIWPSRVLFDLMVTFRNLRQMQNVGSLYEYLHTSKGNLPPYVRQAAAGALLADHYPDLARELYQGILEEEPKNDQAQNGLFYAYVETENFSDAYALIDRLQKEEPMFRSFRDKNYSVPNNRYLDLGVYSCLARFYGDQLEKAYRDIDQLYRHAPANGWLLEVRGQVANARNWHRQALADFQYVSMLDPNSLEAQAGEISSLIALREYQLARPLLSRLVEADPNSYYAADVQREWLFARKPSYYGDLTYITSSGPELDGDGVVGSAELISAPLNDSVYLQGSYRYAWSEIIEGEETYHRYAAGLSYQPRDWIAQAQLTANDSTLNEVGGMVQLDWTPDDFQSFSLAAERFSKDTPLRALYYSIRADSLSGSFRYRWSEQRDLSLGVQAFHFTDGNDRMAGSTVFRQRLVDIPHLDIDGRLEMYGSHNTREDAPYFNPRDDFSLLGALHFDHVYYRHYEHLLAQQIDLGYGYYDQAGYGAQWIGHVRYEQRYKLNPWLEMLAGVEFGRNVYDGEAEPYKLVRCMINGKF